MKRRNVRDQVSNELEKLLIRNERKADKNNNFLFSKKFL